MTQFGYLQPDDKYIKKMFFLKPGLPILTIAAKNGERLTFWNTFYQEKIYPQVTTHQWMKILDYQYSQASSIKALVSNYLKEYDELQRLDFNI